MIIVDSELSSLCTNQVQNNVVKASLVATADLWNELSPLLNCRLLTEIGGGGAHNNMPPYLVL